MTEKSWFRTLMISVITLFAISCGPTHYSANDLANLNAKTITGKVSKQARGSFIILDKNGTEITFNTGQLTQYIPDDYRSQKDDEVRIVFQESWRDTGKKKRAVLQLEAINVPAKNMAPIEPLEGTIISFGKGSTKYVISMLLQTDNRENPFQIYIPKTDNVLKLNGKYISSVNTAYINSSQGYSFEKLIGGKTKALIKHAPILRGNAYVFEAIDIEVTIKSN